MPLFGTFGTFMARLGITYYYSSLAIILKHNKFLSLWFLSYR
jgi:hypothetical protein